MDNGLNEEIKKIEETLKLLRKTIKDVIYIQPDFVAVFYRDLRTVLKRLNTVIEDIKKYDKK